MATSGPATERDTIKPSVESQACAAMTAVTSQRKALT
jgi:hypothetical protein